MKLHEITLNFHSTSDRVVSNMRTRSQGKSCISDTTRMPKPRMRMLQMACETLQFVGDLKTRKRTGTSSQIEIHFSIQISKFLIKYNLLWL